MDGPEDRTHLGTLGTPRSPSSQARFSRLMTQQKLQCFYMLLGIIKQREGGDSAGEGEAVAGVIALGG